ncbi:MAG: glycoside hydrolase family 15 protein [Gammaproteobacteria bacterium]|nr:glycoside hydrolase family 15 protein [Gammaproteobacteria bacterium]
MTAPATSLDQGVIGNCSIAALVDAQARVTWCCLPRPDGDPVFHALLNGAPPEADGPGDAARGFWSIDVGGLTRVEQSYAPNTAVLVTRLHDHAGQVLEVTDFMPRFASRGRMFRPMQLMRRLRPVVGCPRVRVRLRPCFRYGAVESIRTRGSNHIRYVGPDLTLRLTTDAPVTYVWEETTFLLEEPINFVLGPDETLSESIAHTVRAFQEHTEAYWREWVRRLALPLEWQDAVIRAAITLKLCTYEETGAIVAALTTSIPEAASSGRNWDYRYCWLRDAFFVVRALNSLSEVETMEHYLRYIANLVGTAWEDRRDGGSKNASAPPRLQPVYGIGLEARLPERMLDSLAGYRGMGPVRVGNQAYEHYQHDVYGNVVLAASQAFFDRRLLRPAGAVEFERLERLGERAYAVYATPDAGMWELRTRAAVHTSSALMCWAACDRLAKIARQLQRPERERVWRSRAEEIRQAIEASGWNGKAGHYSDSFGGSEVEAGLLLMAEIGFHRADDPRFVATLAAIERTLKHGPYLFRYAAADDFGKPKNAFNICTFWYIDALVRSGRGAQARELFEHMLSCRNPLGLLSEDVDPACCEAWGNFPQTYSMVGIINAATRLSRRWEEVV